MNENDTQNSPIEAQDDTGTHDTVKLADTAVNSATDSLLGKDTSAALAKVNTAEQDRFTRHAYRLMDADGRYVRTLWPHIDGLGYSLIKIKRHAPQGYKGPLLQILAEPKDRTRRMGVEDCRTLSRTLSAILDVEELFSGPFTLEVSSGGIDRPLTYLQDFERFAGFEAKITIDPPADNGQKRFAGHIIGLEKDEDGQASIIGFKTDEDEELAFDYERIAQAKLVYSEALMAAAKEKVL